VIACAGAAFAASTVHAEQGSVPHETPSEELARLRSMSMTAALDPAAFPSDGHFAAAPAELGSATVGVSSESTTDTSIAIAAAASTGDGDSGIISASGCNYRQRVDHAHGPTSGDVSTHGWWVNEGGTCPTLANVDVYLQAYWCNSFGCDFFTVASNSADVKAKNLSNQRVTTRETCDPTSYLVGWRSFVDVDLKGVSDPSGFTYSFAENLYCAPG
jgi:uncharacterized membrane protein